MSYIRKVSVSKDVFSLNVQFICWIRESWVCIRFISYRFELNMTGCDRFDRRFRIYEMSDYGETIRTYKRLADEEVVDEMALAGQGASEPYVW